MKIKSYKIYSTKDFDEFQKTFQNRVINDKAFYSTKYEQRKIVTIYNDFAPKGIPINIQIEQERNTNVQNITYSIETLYVGLFIACIFFSLVLMIAEIHINKDHRLLYLAPIFYLAIFIIFFGVVYNNVSTSFNTIQNC